MNYTEAVSTLEGGRDKRSRPIANNTRVERIDDDTIGIKLHDTHVVKLHPDGSVTLDSGGWLTLTTKGRMNDHLGRRGRIGSDRGVWYVYPLRVNWSRDDRVRFFDGIRIAADGTILNPPDPKLEARKREAEVKMRKRIDTFVGGYMKALADGMPVPSGGDCWHCSMFEPAGMADNDHLLAHLTERYYVPTLLWNAMKERGYRDVSVVMSSFLDYKAFETGTQRVRREWQSEAPDKRQLSDFRRVLGKYLRKRLIPTVAV